MVVAYNKRKIRIDEFRDGIRRDDKRKMKQFKYYSYSILHGLGLLITIAFDAVMYPRLPDTIATQISTHGEMGNLMPKGIYMSITVGILLLLYILGKNKDRTGRIKNSIVSVIIIIANIVMLSLQ